jgi:hypothetical protein
LGGYVKKDILPADACWSIDDFISLCSDWRHQSIFFLFILIVFWICTKAVTIMITIICRRVTVW